MYTIWVPYACCIWNVGPQLSDKNESNSNILLLAYHTKQSRGWSYTPCVIAVNRGVSCGLHARCTCIITVFVSPPDTREMGTLLRMGATPAEQGAPLAIGGTTCQRASPGAMSPGALLVVVGTDMVDLRGPSLQRLILMIPELGPFHVVPGIEPRGGALYLPRHSNPRAYVHGPYCT